MLPKGAMLIGKEACRMLQKRPFLLYMSLLMVSVPYLEASSATDEDAAQMRVAEAIRRGEQFAQIGEYSEAIKEYQQALEANRSASLRSPSLAHFRRVWLSFWTNLRKSDRTSCRRLSKT